MLRTSHLQEHLCWKVEIDNAFAKHFHSSTTNIQPEFQPPEECCQTCSNMLQRRRSVCLKSLETSAKDCWVCGELRRRLEVFIKSHCRETSSQCDQDEVCNECQKKEIYVVKKGSTLTLDDGPRVLRICRDPGKVTVILNLIRN
jgi:hypothetical protein